MIVAALIKHAVSRAQAPFGTYFLMPQLTAGRKTIVIGASAGGITPLREILRSLPSDLPATIFVVVHLSAGSPRFLAEFVASPAGLKVEWAKPDIVPQLGTVYIAPPDRHLLVKPNLIQLSNAPRENHFRPSIDVTFRTAAKTAGSRVIAVVLSGALNDGTYGAMMVKAQGGTVIVQDLEEAEDPSMPRGVLDNCQVDFSLRTAEIAPTLMRLVETGNGKPVSPSASSQTVDRVEKMTSPDEPPNGTLVPYVCPDCGGSLWISEEGNLVRFKCHTGHIFTSDVLVAQQSEALESALWSAVRVINEHVSMLRRIGAAGTKAGSSQLASRNLIRADELQAQGLLIRGMLLNSSTRPSDIDVTAAKAADR